ncbi:MAG TPA: PIG-L deacetylase family protein [Nakamurella sp.]
MDNHLQVLPEDWTSALAVVAHPGDMEYCAAAAVARWAAAGKRVIYLLATRGEAGIDAVNPKEARKIRTKEQIAGCAAAGAQRLEFLDHPDGVIADSMLLRREIAATIRRHRPEVVITVNHHETWGGRVLNQADHRIVGAAVLDAVHDAGNRWAFGDLRGSDGKSLEQWAGVRFTAVAGSPAATHAVDITGFIDAGVAALRCHAQYLAGLGDSAPDPEALLLSTAEHGATKFGGRPAATFEVYR